MCKPFVYLVLPVIGSTVFIGRKMMTIICQRGNWGGTNGFWGKRVGQRRLVMTFPSSSFGISPSTEIRFLFVRLPYKHSVVCKYRTRGTPQTGPRLRMTTRVSGWGGECVGVDLGSVLVVRVGYDQRGVFLLSKYKIIL